MDEIRELLQRLGQLTNEEITNLRQLVATQFADLDTDDATVDDTAVLVELADIADQVMAEGAAREQKAQESREAREAARERIKAINPPDEDTTEEETPDDEPVAEETPDEPEAETTEETVEETVPEPVAASAVQRMARTSPKPSPSPEANQPTGGRITAVLTASSGHARGREITDPEDLGREIASQLESMPRDGANRGRVIVASARAEYPAERKLDGDADANTRKIEAVTSRAAQTFDRMGALVATGGICAPVNVDYAVPTWATPERPIKDGLPSFEATRGGIVFVQSPDIAEWEAATSIWTEATDASPGGETKPIKSITCGAEEKVFLEAVPTRVGVGNMFGRFAPEQLAANTDMAFAAAARVAEENLLNLIEGVAVKKIETAQHLGAARDLFSNIAFAVASYRNIHRIPESQTFTVLLPVLAKELIRADLAREQAHDNSGSFNVWMVSDEMIDALFSQYHINVIWHLDGQKEPASKNYESQYAVASHVAESKKIDEIFPAAAWETKGLVWYFFPEGVVQFLDGGRLDLGVVRDSTLDATNDYELFVETFESIANRGFAKAVWQVQSIVKATGGSAATVTAVAP